MNNNLFRRKNLEKISSPENLDAFLRVTNPSMWMGFCAIIILLIGFTVWAFCGNIESKANGVIISTEDQTLCYVSEKKITEIKTGMTIRVETDTYQVAEISENAVPADAALSDYAMQLGGFQNGEYVYALKPDRPVAPGTYACSIVLETLHPIDFLK